MPNPALPFQWPSIEKEIAAFQPFLKGVVLNAGAGRRRIQAGDSVINLDLDPRVDPDVVGSLLNLPFAENSLDSVLSIAAIEHVERPWVAFEEFFRVLKPGGYAVVGAPFLQPEHPSPGDFYRFTSNGLKELAKHAGFEVVKVEAVHHFGLTLGWILWEFFCENRPKSDRLFSWMSWALVKFSQLPFLKRQSPKTNNTYYIVVRKTQKPNSLSSEMN